MHQTKLLSHLFVQLFIVESNDYCYCDKKIVSRIVSIQYADNALK